MYDVSHQNTDLNHSNHHETSVNTVVEQEKQAKEALIWWKHASCTIVRVCTSYNLRKANLEWSIGLFFEMYVLNKITTLEKI